MPLSQPVFVYTTHTIPQVGDVVFVTDDRDTREYAAAIRGSWTPSPALRYCIETLVSTDQFVDVGANIGEFALPIGKLDVNTLAIEPLGTNIALLRDGVGRNQLPCIHVVHGGAWDTTGKAFVTGHSAWGQVMSEDPVSQPASEIHAYRLDDLLSQYGFERPRIIKIDVEGSERRVLRGMPTALADPEVELIVESYSWMCHSLGYTYHDLLLELEQAGFSLYLFHERVLVPRSSTDLQEACVADYLATRRRLTDPVGSFTVRPLALEESVEILARNALYSDQSEFGPAHRWHLDRYLDEAPPAIRHHPAIRSLMRSSPIVRPRTGARLRMAWVVHQYGLEVGGGSETLCRAIAELLSPDIDSTVLTTTARHYDPWHPFYPPGEDMINGVRVLRFPADQARPSQLRALYNDAHAHPHDSVRGRRWLDGVGPRSADLVKYIRTHALEYDVLCAIPYVFRTTLEALEAFPGPKVLIPCAHDEPAFGLDVYRQVFDLADATVFNTDEERQLIEERFGIRSLVTGTIGFPMPGCFGTEPSAFRLTNGVVGPYILYIGRIHPSKGCQTLLQYHQASLNGARDTTLVLMGTSFMDLSDAHNVLVTGFVDDQTKQQALAGASAIVLPSPNESLSIVALEAWAHARPVLATAESAVLVGQCERSSGGVWYRNESEFVSLLGTMLDFPGLATAVGLAGREWGNRVYDHRRVAKQWSDVLTAVLSSTEPRGPVG